MLKVLFSLITKRRCLSQCHTLKSYLHSTMPRWWFDGRSRRWEILRSCWSSTSRQPFSSACHQPIITQMRILLVPRERLDFWDTSSAVRKQMIFGINEDHGDKWSSLQFCILVVFVSKHGSKMLMGSQQERRPSHAGQVISQCQYPCYLTQADNTGWT